ncbi:MAG: hypothetical protein Q7J03_05675 [Methanoregula sp.]|nr:hypothetical protein [Methanoregula sp.]
MKLLGKNSRGLPAIIRWGCFGGVSLAAGYLLVQWIWDRFLPDAVWFSAYHDAQLVIVFAFVLALLGVIAGDLFSTGKESQELTIGIFSGISTALVFLTITVSLTTVLGTEVIPLSPFLVAGIVVSSVALQGIGAWFHEPCSKSGMDETNIMEKPGFAKKIRNYRFLLFIIIAVTIIPPTLLFLGISTGVIAEQSPCYAINDNVDVSRTGSDSIRIVMQPDTREKFVSLPFANISLGENDVSNQQVITTSGLDDTIEPPDGLLYRSGASVILRGRDASGNETVPVHLQIIVTYPDTGIRYMICDMQI